MLEGLLKTVGRSAEEFMKPGQQMPRDWGQVYGRSRKALIDAVGEMDRDAVFKGCMEHGTPCGKFLSREEVMEDAQVKHNETFQTIVHPEAGKFRTPLPPARFSNTPSQLRAPPLFGQNTDEVLAEFGFDAEEVAALRRGGVTK
jgi:crotonobetainyl-CoA:carnitine CoA-transferase CaiB-like acyl-CoA transferase